MAEQGFPPPDKKKEEQPQPTAMNAAFSEAKPLKSRSESAEQMERYKREGENGRIVGQELLRTLFQNPQAPEAPATAAEIPGELLEIYGGKVPPSRVLEMYGKLKSPVKRKSYLDKLRADEEAGKKRESRKQGNSEKTTPSDVERAKKSIEKHGLTFDLSEPAPEAPENVGSSENLDSPIGIELTSERESRERKEAATRQIFGARESSGTQAIPGAEPERESESLPAVFHQLYRKPQQVPASIETSAPARDEYPHDWGSQKWRRTLSELVEKLKNKTSRERLASAKEYLNNRAKEIDTAAEVSGLEKIARTIGERYNKLSLIQKLGIGVTLGVGTAVGSAFSLPLALVGLSGLVAQRAAGAAGMFVRIEKSLQEKKIAESYQFMATKERAALDAMLYTFVMGTAINKGLELAREYNVVEHTREWLGNMLGHRTPETPVPSGVAQIAQNQAPGMQSSAVASAHEAAAAAKAEIPQVSVGAKAGYGYEYMVKQLWRQLHDKNISLPEGANQESDLARLLKADDKTIDSIVHKIAADPKHGFFNANGTSVRIDPSAHLTIGTDGQLHFGDAMHPDIIHAAEGMAATPAYHPGVLPDLHQVSVPAETAVAHTVDTQAPAPVETATPHAVGTQAPAPVETATPRMVETQAPAPVETATAHPIPVHPGAETIPTQAPAPVVNHDFIVNKFDVSIPVAEPHIYADSAGEHLLVYGGSPVERAKMILDYLSKNPDKVVYSADDANKYRIPWHLVDGKILPESPVETRGFLGFFKTFMKAPSPDEFRSIIK